MKKLFLTLLVIFTINLSAQTTPTGYDGGSELQRAILKSRSKQPAKKSTKAKHIVTVTELQPPAHTKEEANYYLIYREESASYLRKLMASDYWKAQQKIANQAELESKRLYDEQAPQRKKDSIAKAEQIALQDKKRAESSAKFQRRADSLDAAYKKEREDYYNEQKRQQKANRK